MAISSNELQTVSTQRLVAELARRSHPYPAMKLQAQQELLKLTPRQLDVARLIARGLNTKQAARELGVSPRTVEIHRRFVNKRLGIECQGIAYVTKLITLAEL